ncbi:MAG: hypothetical protein J1E85_01975 [Ruminococcus sp.]|nr:hypothetical protein [Ruminococcus sp.]
MEDRDEIVISLTDVIEILKRNIIFIVATVLIFSLCSFFITKFFIPKSYTATISLYVETTNDDNEKQGTNIVNEQTYAQKLVATYIKMLNTNTFYSELSEKLNNKYSAKELSRMISFIGDDETEIFEAKVVTNSPAESKQIADTVGEIAPETISRLKSKATLKIVDYAQLPDSKSAPNTTKNVFFAFALGLALSLAISFLRSFLDKKIKYNENMTTFGDFPILAAIPKFDNFQNSAKSANSSKKEG